MRRPFATETQMAALLFRGQDVLGATAGPDQGALTITQQHDGYVTLASLDAPVRLRVLLVSLRRP